MDARFASGKPDDRILSGPSDLDPATANIAAELSQPYTSRTDAHAVSIGSPLNQLARAGVIPVRIHPNP